MERARRLDRKIVLLCIAGILVSTYALHVEVSAETNKNYKAFCDFSEKAMCSRVLTSKYAKGFGILPVGIPNSVYGTLYYCLMIYLTTYHNFPVVRLQLILSSMALCMSFYLAYLLAFVLHDFCMVCVSTYIINGCISRFVYIKYIDEKDKQA